MTTNQPTLKDFAIRMRNLVARDLEVAADLRQLAKEMRDTGFQAAVLKAWVKAIIAYDDGDKKPLERLTTRTADVALYGGILGFAVDGFGESNRIGVNEYSSPRGEGDGDTVSLPAVAESPRHEEMGSILPSPSIPKAAPVTNTGAPHPAGASLPTDAPGAASPSIVQTVDTPANSGGGAGPGVAPQVPPGPTSEIDLHEIPPFLDRRAAA